MKKTITITTIFLGVFMMAGIVSASDADMLQPASTITYNEDLTVNGTGRFDSVYIGKQGVGGVTFFNGTIVNATTGDGDSNNPVTFGDDVRIDGEIYRIQKGGDPLKISDNVIPTANKLNDLGSSENRWANIYGESLNISNNVSIANNLTVKSLITTESLQIGGGYGSSGITAEPDGGLKVDGNITVDGKVDGVNVSHRNAVYYSEDSDSTSELTVPSSNPYQSKIVTGVADIQVANCSAGGVISVLVDLPTSFTSTSTYTLIGSEEKDRSLSIPAYDRISMRKVTASQIQVHARCADNSTGTNNIEWIAIGY